MTLKGYTLSGYTTTFNCREMRYPFELSIRSLLGFCDEVVVVDAGSSDGTIETLEQLSRTDSRVKVFIEPVDFSHPRWAIHQDGYLKAKARAKCTAEYCWQTDTDEYLAESDYEKLKKLPQVLQTAGENTSLMMLPLIEYWGSFDFVRADFHPWKPRFSKNDPGITHGIPNHHKLLDDSGHPYPKAYFSDSCDYIYRETGEKVPIFVPLDLSREEMAAMSPQTIRDLYLKCLDLFPSVHHVSWLNLERKIWHYKRFWRDFHASMYNKVVSDTAENNVMFDKPWSEVTAEDIREKAIQLKTIGPRSFHKKLDPNVQGPTYAYKREVPTELRKWGETTNFDPPSDLSPKSAKTSDSLQITGDAGPLISAVIPSYNKAEYLAEAVGSVLFQGYPNLEIVIVNDGSPDNTSEVARRIAANCPNHRIVLVEKENGGISDARNHGIANAQGEFILTLDGDDLAAPGFINEAMAYLVDGRANLVSSNVEVFGSQPGEWIPNFYDPFHIRYDNCIPTLAIYRKDLWAKAGGYNVAFPFVEDWDFWLALTKHDLRFKRLETKYFRYRSSETGLAAIFTNRFQECLAMVATSHPDLYPVEEVMYAHLRFVEFPDKFFDRFTKQLAIHQNNSLLHFWMGLKAERDHNPVEAASFYSKAFDLSGRRSWQPIYRLGLLNMIFENPTQARSAFHIVRTLRPDMSNRIEGLLADPDKVTLGGQLGPEPPQPNSPS